MATLYIFCGIPFSGKTVLTKELASRLGYTRIDLDEVKEELFGQDVADAEIDASGWDTVYAKMYGQIARALRNGQTVIHDTGNFTRFERAKVREIAEKLGAAVLTVFVDTPAPVASRRLMANRQTPSRFDVTDEDFASSVEEMEPPDHSEPHIIFKDGENLSEWIQAHFTNKMVR